METQSIAPCPHRVRRQPAQCRDVAIAEAHALGRYEQLVIQGLSGGTESRLQSDQPLELGYEPGRDAGSALDDIARGTAPQEGDQAPEPGIWRREEGRPA